MSVVLISSSNSWQENVCIIVPKWEYWDSGDLSWYQVAFEASRLSQDSALTGTETWKVTLRLWLCDANLKGPWERVWWPWSSVGNLCSWVRLCRGTSQSSEHALSLSSSDFWWLCIFLICLYFSPLCSRLIPSNLSPLPLIGVDLSGAEGRPPLPHLIGLTLVNYRSVVGCMEKGVGLNEVILLLTPFGIRNKMLLCFLLFIACKYYFLTVHVFLFCFVFELLFLTCFLFSQSINQKRKMMEICELCSVFLPSFLSLEILRLGHPIRCPRREQMGRYWTMDGMVYVLWWC